MFNTLPPEIIEKIICELECEMDVPQAWFALFNTFDGLGEHIDRRHKNEILQNKDERYWSEEYLKEWNSFCKNVQHSNTIVCFDDVPYARTITRVTGIIDELHGKMECVKEKLLLHDSIDGETLKEKIEGKQAMETIMYYMLMIDKKLEAIMNY